MQVAHNQPDCGLVSEASSSGKVPSVDEYVGELLARIQPARASEERRRSVAQYVQDVIARAFLPAHEVSDDHPMVYGCVSCPSQDDKGNQRKSPYPKANAVKWRLRGQLVG